MQLAEFIEKNEINLNTKTVDIRVDKDGTTQYIKVVGECDNGEYVCIVPDKEVNGYLKGKLVTYSGSYLLDGDIQFATGDKVAGTWGEEVSRITLQFDMREHSSYWHTSSELVNAPNMIERKLKDFVYTLMCMEDTNVEVEHVHNISKVSFDLEKSNYKLRDMVGMLEQDETMRVKML